MSTTFGVKIPGDEVIEIARRVGTTRGAEITFTDELGHLLPDDLDVIALDNTAQGIHTIGDIKRHINRQEQIDNHGK